MSNVFIQLDYACKRTDLPKINDVQDIVYVEKFEASAYGHWLFLDSTPLVDRVNGRTLTQPVGATIAPVITTEGVRLSNQLGNGLISDLADGATTGITQFSVCKVSATALANIQGDLVGSASTTSSGTGVYISANKVYANMKPLIASNTGALNGTTVSNTVALNDFVLVAHCIDKLSKKMTLYVLDGVVENSVTNNFAPAYEANTNKIGIGNNYYSPGNSGLLTTIETIIFDKALTLAEIKKVAQRTKLRLENRGIVF